MWDENRSGKKSWGDKSGKQDREKEREKQQSHDDGEVKTRDGDKNENVSVRIYDTRSEEDKTL